MDVDKIYGLRKKHCGVGARAGARLTTQLSRCDSFDFKIFAASLHAFVAQVDVLSKRWQIVVGAVVRSEERHKRGISWCQYLFSGRQMTSAA